MEKALLWGAALLGCLVLVYGDPVCNVTAEKTVLKDARRVLVECIVTGNGTSITWIEKGQPVPQTQTLPMSLFFEMPIEEAKGEFECTAQCGDRREAAYIELSTPGNWHTAIAIATAIVFLLGLVLVILVLIHGICYYRRQPPRRRVVQIVARVSRRARAGHLLSNGHATRP